MPETTIRVALALLALTFAWAALAKFVRFADWRAALERYELPRPVRALAAGLVPGAELAVAALVVVGLGKPAAALALALLAAFSLALLRAQSRLGDRLPCGCFGRNKQRDYRVMITRNALLGVLAAIVLVPAREVALLDGITAPGRGESLAAALALAGIAAIGVTALAVMHGTRRGEPR